MTVVKELDFEETQTYYVNIQASDKAVAPERRRTALTVLTVHVTDSDDQVSRHRAVVIHQIKNTENNIDWGGDIWRFLKTRSRQGQAQEFVIWT